MNTEPHNLTRERVIEYLRVAIFDGRCGLSDVPALIKRVIREDLWRRRVLPATGERVVFDSFAEFTRAAPPEGLGCDDRTLRRLCADDAETLDLLAQTKKERRPGGDRKSRAFKDNNVNFEKAKKGNSIEYSLKRLRRQRPDLHQQILDGELTINRAMITAGFRQRPFQISRDLPKTAATLKCVFSPAQLEQLISLLRRSD